MRLKAPYIFREKIKIERKREGLQDEQVLWCVWTEQSCTDFLRRRDGGAFWWNRFPILRFLHYRSPFHSHSRSFCFPFLSQISKSKHAISLTTASTRFSFLWNNNHHRENEPTRSETTPSNRTPITWRRNLRRVLIDAWERETRNWIRERERESHSTTFIEKPKPQASLSSSHHLILYYYNLFIFFVFTRILISFSLSLY